MNKISEKEIDKLRIIVHDTNLPTIERLNASELLVEALCGFPKDIEITIKQPKVTNNG
ncbi:MAG: hypothetical protein ACK5HP_01285 [Bacilli bacterium]